MSRAYKCDRCGEFYDIPDKIDRFTIQGEPVDTIAVHSHYNPMHYIDKFDLCPNCANAFANWLTETGACKYENENDTDLIDDSRR